jgi:cell division protein FtsX
LKVTYSTKDDALSFLQKKVPDVVENFQKFGITNPLPATLYIMFSNDAQYTALKTVILQHKAIILNPSDVDNGTSIKQQENRILNTINMSNVIVTISYSVIVLLLIIVFVFLVFLLQTIFGNLHKEFEVKKLLGASHLDVTKSFVLVTLDILLLAFVICFVLLLLSGLTLNIYLTSLFNFSLMSILANIGLFVLVFVIQIIVIGGAGVGLAYRFTNVLHKKLHMLS